MLSLDLSTFLASQLSDTQTTAAIGSKAFGYITLASQERIGREQAMDGRFQVITLGLLDHCRRLGIIVVPPPTLGETRSQHLSQGATRSAGISPAHRPEVPAET